MMKLRKYNIAYIFIVSILLSPLFYKLFKLPLSFVVFVVVVFFSFKIRFSFVYNNLIFILTMLVFAFNILLLVSILIGLNYPIINTYVYSDPVIPEYYQTKQFVLGIFYNNLLFLYMFVFYFLIKSKNYINTVNSLKNILRIIYFFGFINILINFIEIFFPPLHEKLMLIAGYHQLNYYFVLRPVSIVLNSYINAFLCAFFSFWSLHNFYETIDNKWEKLKYFIFFILGIVATFIAGARYALILLFISMSLYTILQRKLKFLFLIIFFLLIAILSLFKIDKSYLYLLSSIITLSDKVGSANTHKELFFSSIKIFIENPWGVGIGKTDFGALNTIPELTYNPESYLLSLLLGGGLFAVVIYLTIHLMLLIKLFKRKFFHVFSFNLATLIVSLINIQVLQSATITAIIAILYIHALYNIRHKYIRL